MAITSMQKTFGERLGSNNNSANARPVDDRPKAEYWMNVGQLNDVINETSGEIEQVFVGILGGIALDTAEKLPTNRGTPMFVARNAARNELHDDVLEVCKTLAPGEHRYIGDSENGLVIQILRVKGDVAPVRSSENPFRRKLTLAAAE